MNVNYKLLSISSFCAVAIGCAISTVIINSENGYVGSIIVFPLLLLVSFVGFILFIIGFIVLSFDKKSLGVCLLFSAFLLPASFIASCLIAKYFEIGAYRQQPMISFPVAVSMIVLKDMAG
jgi:Zn-dependent membrane protease YugP